MGPVQEILHKFEVYDGATWQNLSNNIPTSGLVGYWPFDEGVGSYARDQSSYCADGTLYNMTVDDHVAGKFGNALDFDGSNDYVEVGDAAQLDITAAITISVWVKPVSIPSWAAILTKGTNSGWDANNYTLGLASGRVDFRWNGKGTVLVDIGDAMTAGNWYHVVAIAAPGTTNALSVYINGVLKKQGNRSGDPTPNAQALRFATDNGTDNYPGLIDEVRIYNRALTTDEIAALYCPLNKSYLKSLSFSLGGAGMSPDPIAGTWSATLNNDDGIFHPKHPTSTYKDLLRIGRKVRLSVGGKYGGTAYYWQRLIGYMDAPKFQNGARTVTLSGCDYTKALTDTILRMPNNYWGSSVVISTVASAPALGSELYVHTDAVRVSPENNTMSDWTADDGTIAPVTDGGGGSTYAGELTASPAYGSADAFIDSIGAVTSGKTYQVTFKYVLMAGGGDTEFGLRIYATGTNNQMGAATGLKSWSWAAKTFYFTATVTGALRVGVALYDPSYSTPAGRFDVVSIKEVTAWTNTRYNLPAACNGPYYATLDGIPHWYGETDPPQGWFYDEANKIFYFVDGYPVYDGTNNLIVYYYTNQAMENVVADLLVTVGLYATQAAALADMIYTATGITVPKVWFDAGVSALDALRQVCERCNYRFWFDETGKPVFRPAPAAGTSMASFTGRQLQDLSDYQDMNELRNRIVIEGIEQAMYVTSEDVQPSRFKGEVSDETSILAYLENTYSTTNRLFQTQATIDAMCVIMLALYKDPKWYADLQVPSNAIPLQRGDTITWDVILRAVLGDGSNYSVPQYGDGTHYGDEGLRAVVKGIIRDISYSGGGFRYKCELTA